MPRCGAWGACAACASTRCGRGSSISLGLLRPSPTAASTSRWAAVPFLECLPCRRDGDGTGRPAGTRPGWSPGFRRRPARIGTGGPLWQCGADARPPSPAFGRPGAAASHPGDVDGASKERGPGEGDGRPAERDDAPIDLGGRHSSSPWRRAYGPMWGCVEAEARGLWITRRLWTDPGWPRRHAAMRHVDTSTRRVARHPDTPMFHVKHRGPRVCEGVSGNRPGALRQRAAMAVLLRSA
ncbi:hypothetical protein LX16_2240 [Stackebrandtia albiflava]|uniref:Uncharacterized protein n=1 Tax=Stackebrandtia albiflava TaxID=406432 RepID=A0A562V142_9ACTN|nr:hypothetical protein LX16_2240 [Stackebrandtia albiflava]